MDDDALMSLGQWIKRRRKALDLTQESLAALVGCSKDLIVKIEGDARRPSRQVAALLAQHLGLAFEEREPFVRCARGELAPIRLPPPARSVPRPQFAPLPAPIQGAPAPEANASFLPAQTTALLGREADVAALAALLGREGVRLVTLTGPGGVGKTRLVLAVAARLEHAYADGATFVDLAPISDLELVAATIARALGLALGERPVDQVKVALRHRRMLLVLDNYEQVLAAAPLVAELLAAAPMLTVLATSRVALRLGGEYEYAVTPLALPDLARLPPPEQLAQYAALALFIERAQAAKASFAATGANLPAIAAICARLDGLPLAIELAAARVKLLPPEALLARLERDGGLALLSGGPRDLPQRQQTIRDTIVWSYNLLDGDEQRLFRHLGVFVGGWSLEAAAFVLGDVEGGPASALPALELLAALVDHSLVVMEEAGGEARYRLLETLREYALERLCAAGEEDEARRRYATFFAAWAERDLASPDGAYLLTSAPLARDLDNVRAALAWSLGRSGEDARYGLRLFASLWKYWFWLYQNEGFALAKRAVACVESQPQDLIAAQVYNGAALLWRDAVDGRFSVELLQRSLALARQYDDRLLQAEVLRHMAETPHDMELVQQELEESLAISRELGDTTQEAWTTFDLGMTAKYHTDFVAAEQFYQESLALFAQANNVLGPAFVLRGLANLSKDRGDMEAADDYLLRALAFVDALGAVTNFSPLMERGQLAYARGEYKRAIELLSEGYEQVRQRGNYMLGPLSLLWQARCHQALGDIGAALDCCRQAMAHERSTQGLLGMVSVIGVCCASVRTAAKHFVDAARLLGSVGAYRSAFGYPLEWEEADWLQLHDQVLADCRDALDAESFSVAWEAGGALPLAQAIAEALEL